MTDDGYDGKALFDDAISKAVRGAGNATPLSRETFEKARDHFRAQVQDKFDVCKHGRATLKVASRLRENDGYNTLYKCSKCGARKWLTELPMGFWDGAPLHGSGLPEL